MALSDLVVLMNDGRIEQRGTPREIFNHPRSEFTARFIGGHNVIDSGGETVAVRIDRMALRRPADPVDGPALAGTISKIEYQGTYVLIAVLPGHGDEISVQIGESELDAGHFAIG
jgi:putative spermidine/putrescine transport system ATP-binding protein